MCSAVEGMVSLPYARWEETVKKGEQESSLSDIYHKVEVEPMTQERIDRLNELARKHKGEGLTEAETLERQALREDYLASFRASLTAQLENIYYVDDAGNQEKLKRKDDA